MNIVKRHIKEREKARTKTTIMCHSEWMKVAKILKAKHPQRPKRSVNALQQKYLRLRPWRKRKKVPKRWSDEEIELLLCFGDSKDQSWEVIAHRHFEDRSAGALSAKYNKIQNQKPMRKIGEWSVEEIARLIQLADNRLSSGMRWKEIANQFQHRSRNAVQKKYKALKQEHKNRSQVTFSCVRWITQ